MKEKNRNTDIDRKMRFWLFLMKLGERSGCHQRPERSFFFKGYQFPVCARCTGIFIGYLWAGICFHAYHASIPICIALLLPMAVDGISQYAGFRESNQILRLITGILGGYAVMTILIRIVLYMITLVG